MGDRLGTPGAVVTFRSRHFYARRYIYELLHFHARNIETIIFGSGAKILCVRSPGGRPSRALAGRRPLAPRPRPPIGYRAPAAWPTKANEMRGMSENTCRMPFSTLLILNQVEHFSIAITFGKGEKSYRCVRLAAGRADRTVGSAAAAAYRISGAGRLAN